MDITSKRWLEGMRQRHRVDYQVEVELADALRNTPASDRPKAYIATHEELFRRRPDVPHLLVDKLAQAKANLDRLQFIRSLGFGNDSTLLQLGAGDGSLCVAAAPFFRRVIGSEFSTSIGEVHGAAPNVETFVMDGVTLPLEDDSVDVVYSDQLIQKLHPDDVAAHLADVRRVLMPTGRFVCVTANGASGPHDISVFYDEKSRGIHLREYDSVELSATLRQAGFDRVQYYLGGRGRYFPVPDAAMSVVEGMFARLPRATRSRLTESKLVANTYPFMGINAVADNLGD